MRKLLALAVAVLVTCGATAQTTQGRFAVSGVASYSTGSGSGDREINGKKLTNSGSSHTLSPSVGYFVKDNLLIGASMQYSRHETRSEAPTSVTLMSNNLNSRRDEFRIFARQYKYLSERFALQATLAGGTGEASQYVSNMHSNPQFGNYHYRYHSKLRTVSLSPGIAFFPSDRLALSANLGALQYEHSTTNSASWRQYQGTPIPEHNFKGTTSTANSFEFDLSTLNLNFGLSFFIGK